MELARSEQDDGAAWGRWLATAVMTLVLAGGLALALVVGRAPIISEWIADPRFFRRALVVHVVLSLWGWFFACAVGLRILTDGVGSRCRYWVGWWLTTAGIAAMVGAAAIRGAEPLLVNYIPVIDHPVFMWGLAFFFVGVAVPLCRVPRAKPAVESSVPVSAALVWRATSWAVLLSLVVFAVSWWNTPQTMAPELYYERLFWGVGHTLIVVSVLVMIGAWFFLLRDRVDRSPVGPRVAVALSVGLIVPWLIAPFLALGGTNTSTYIGGFTRLMQWGIAFPVLVAIGLCVWAVWCGCGRRGGRWVFGVSAALTVVGFGLGAMVRGSDTMIPGHYHASLGAITVALMGVFYQLLALRGWNVARPGWRKMTIIQPVVFGVGQLIFAAGFALSGWFGVDRKAYGADQIIDSTGALVGLITMGVGGLTAVVGGAGFLILIAIACIDRWTNQGRQP